MNNYTLINNFEADLQKNLTKARDAIIMTPIIYDEVTRFEDAESYPFEKRKNTLSSNKNSGTEGHGF